MNKDLTIGNPSSVLLRFCLPLFGSVIFQQLYNIADSFVAGRFVSEAALAAVGNSYEVTLIFIAFGFGCNIGCSVITSQLFGAKKFREMKTAVYTSLIFTGTLCAILMLLGFGFGTPLLERMHTPADIFADSRLYLNIYILGIPFVFFYNVSTGIFSAMGDSKTPFYFLAVSSVANIFVDILFTTALSSIFTRGVDGVAWATFLCQGISCMLAMFFVFRRFRQIETEEKPELFSWQLFRRITAVAVPSILQQSFISIGNIVIQGVINSFGSAVIAGYSAAIKLNNLVITSFTTLGTGISNYAAQNLGAGKPERIHAGFLSGLKIVGALSVPFTLLYFGGSRLLLAVFLDASAEAAIRTGMLFLRIVAPFYFIVAAKLVSDGVLRGTGNMNAFMVATFTDLILRVVLAFVFSRFWESTGIWMAWPIGWCVAALLSLGYYRGTKNRNYESSRSFSSGNCR